MNNSSFARFRPGLDAVIGNVHDQTVEEIWTGHAASHLRALLDDGRRDLIHLCSRCDAYKGYDFSRFAVT